MRLPFLHSKDKTKQTAINNLIEGGLHNRDYYVLLIGAILLAIGGIFADSVPVLIASMIVAPLAMPILAIGLGATVGDWKIIKKSTGLLILSCIIALALAILSATLFSSERVKDVYITFTTNLYLATAVAVVAGAIAAYGSIRSKVSGAITGVAIAVSLMPPLVATGIGLASNDLVLATNAGTLFILNVAGILTASMIVFKLFGLDLEYKPKHHQ